MERRYEQAITAFRHAMKDDRPNGAICQRPGPGLRTDRVPDPRRSGAAVGPKLRGQPLDVPRGGRRRASAAARLPAVRTRVGGRPLPDPHRADAGAARPFAQRLVRHLLPGHGLPRGRPGVEHLGRSGRPRPRRPALAADRVPAPGDRRAPAPPHQPRPERLRRTSTRSTSCSTSATTTWAWSRRASSPRASSPPRWKGRPSRSPTCWPIWSVPATAWRSSARSMTSPRARAWPFRPTCWPR